MHINTAECPRAPHTSTAAGVAIEWSDTLPSEEARSAVFTFTNLDTREQTTFEVSARTHHCFSLIAGSYRVAAISPGLQPYRGLVAAIPGEVAHIRPVLNARADTETTLADVMIHLGVPDIHTRTRDLEVPAGKTLILDSTHPAYATDWQTVAIADVDAAKRIIGIADGVWGIDAPRYGGVADAADPAALARSAAREYIYGHAPSVAQWKEQINRSIFAEKWSFAAFILGTVTINAGAVLVIGDKASFFVCQRLRMHVTGTLRVTGHGPGLIQPLAYESFC